MRLEDFVAEWTGKGLTDLGSAKFLLSMRPIPLEVIGFHCQQAVEKYLKAYLVARGVEPEKTHDLVELISFAPRTTPNSQPWSPPARRSATIP